jgi:hypothetical protein
MVQYSMYRTTGGFLQDGTVHMYEWYSTVCIGPLADSYRMVQYSMYRTTGGFLQDGTVQYVVRMVLGTLYILQLPHPGLDSGWKLKLAIRTKMDLGRRIYRGGGARE